ncbi:MAG: 4-(cytidine 5'-diphospho)-2-C-methyl-D-erythritol kinase [Gemmatimonadaceae bacterium]|nr:4-(cytidine 5'-diphospho)-2-C-methyl-D-erythritol kinase [Gemmatimonadaceae bacterium]
MSASSRTENAHAKINLVLRILAREANGYHSIETLFQRIALHDVVTVRVGDLARELTCTGPAVPAHGLGPAEQNLAWRAAELYARETAWETGWSISILKRIPVGGGLGGGSADAAAVLRAMEAMSPAPMGGARLLELAGTLGADVPFLLTQASRAWAWGRGDRLLVLPPLPVVPVLLMPFDEGVNTGAAYQAFAGMREASGELVAAREYDARLFESWAQIATIAENDFERVVPAMHTGVAELLPFFKTLAHSLGERSGTAIGMLSGSGATCFLLLCDVGGNFGFGGVERHIMTQTL